MELHVGNLYWPVTEGTARLEIARPRQADHYDAVIVGGGMSGALCAYTLAQEGLRTAVLERDSIGAGSTAANTGLLQFSNDIMLHKLMRQIGPRQAVRFYKRCQEAVGQLEQAAASLERSCGFTRRSSLYYASSEEDVPALQQEYEALSRHGFPVEYWSRTQLEARYPFSKPAALLTRGDAEVNPYQFCRGLLARLQQSGVHLFERTTMEQTRERPGGWEIQTSQGMFRCSHLICTTGYEAPPRLAKTGVDLNRSYAIATNAVEDLSVWKDKALIWETRRPYLYIRTTAEGRIIAGGLDEDKPHVPHSKALIEARALRLLRKVQALFPMLELQAEYAWGAVFGESVDNLPFIGKHPEKEHLYYLLGYGGNGTVYSMLGSRLLADLILGRPNPEAELLGLERLRDTKHRQAQ